VNNDGGSNSSFDPDLAVLHERCQKYGIPSPIGFTKSGRPYIKRRKHIDLCQVYAKPMIKTTIYKNLYRTAKLDDVAKALINKRKFSSGGISGANASRMAPDLQKKYVLQDAQLVMDLLLANNGQVIGLMQSIAELTGMTLEQVCHTNVSTWWTRVFDSMGCVAPSSSAANAANDLAKIAGEFEYEGGKVLEPVRGLHYNVKVLDVESLYPSMAIRYNLSFDSINCSCCASNEDARVPPEVIDKGYWVCKLKEGAFPRKLREFKDQRIIYKRLPC
jgi:DNA polymerase I